MNRTLTCVAAGVGFMGSALAQDSLEAVLEVERGAHHKTLHTVTRRLLADGVEALVTNKIVALSSGMHYLEDGLWKTSREEIEVVNGWAVATKTPIKVVLANNANSPGAFSFWDPQGRQFRAHVLGLAYADLTTGQSVLVAQIQNCQAILTGNNQVTYPSALAGEAVADIVLTLRQDSFEQDVVIVAAPPPPEAYGLANASSRLEVWTEFVASPPAQVEAMVLGQWENPQGQLIEPDVIDEQISFGPVMIAPGRAFFTDAPEEFGPGNLTILKKWMQVDGRQFLVEGIPWVDAAPALNALGQQAARAPRAPVVGHGGERLLARGFPEAPKGSPGRWTERQQVQERRRQKGYAMDYSVVVTTNGFRFESATVYLVEGSVQLSSTTILEGGTVIRFSTNTAARLRLLGPLDCRTHPWLPATLTSMHDSSLGDPLPGSASGRYGYIALQLGYASQDFMIHDIQVRHIYAGLALEANNKLYLDNAQLSRGYYGILGSSGAIFTGRNVLFHDYTNILFYAVASNRCEHVTAHRVNKLVDATNNLVWLTNSLLVSASNNLAYSGEGVGVSLEDSGVFDSVGSGAHYLPASSPYLDSGVTNLSTNVLQSIRRFTTRAPVVLSGMITNSTVLEPVAVRDTDTPDLGWHAYPMDFVAGGVIVTNATLLLSNSVVLGTWGPDGSYGLMIEDGASLIARGTATEPCRVVRYNLVQDQANTNWSSSSAGPSVCTPGRPLSVHPTLEFRHVAWGMPAAGGPQISAGFEDIPTLAFTHCQFHVGKVHTLYPGMAFTNCLFERVESGFGSIQGDYYNNLFYGGSIEVDSDYGPHRFFDNLFDGTLLSQGVAGVTNANNAYLTNANRWVSNHVSDVLLTNAPAYMTGLLGYFFYPTNDGMLSTLRDKGHRSATNAGLAHFTVWENQEREAGGTNAVEIGYHWPAIDPATGRPWDQDGDGLADLDEDANGDAVAGAAESDWQNAHSEDASENDGVDDHVEWLLGRNPRAGAVADTSGVLGLKVFTPLK